jgi:amidohydrolase
MIAEGAFDGFTPRAMFGLHVASNLHVGQIGVRSGPMMAAYDTFDIVIRGQQTHGARPWMGVDPINVASQIVLGANTIIARQTDLATAPAVLSFGAIHGGLRENIIPEEVRMIGSIRSFTPEPCRSRIDWNARQPRSQRARAPPRPSRLGRGCRYWLMIRRCPHARLRR